MIRTKHIVGVFCGLLTLCAILLSFKTARDEKRAEEQYRTVEKMRVTLRSNKFDKLLENFVRQDLVRKEGHGDLYSIALKFKSFMTLRNAYGKSIGSDEMYDIFQTLERTLFGWAKKHNASLSELSMSFKGKGIVITTGDNFAQHAANCIIVLRLLGCTLPIEVFYNGKDDLTSKWIEYFSEQEGVKVLDLSKIFELTGLNLNRWQSRSFSVLASSFSEVMLLDADVVLLRDPMYLFEEQGYAELGTMFFKDRSMYGYHSKNVTEWLENGLPDGVSSFAKQSAVYQMTSNYQLKTGLMVIDKTKHFNGLLIAGLLNSSPTIDLMRSLFHGDKELFWLGMELAKEPFYFVQSYSATIGEPAVSTPAKNVTGSMICGKAANHDSQGRLLWFSDGLLKDKNDVKSELANLTHLVKERGVHSDYEGACLKGELKELNSEDRKTIEILKAAYKRDIIS